MRQKHCLVRSKRFQACFNDIRISGLSPGKFDACYIKTVSLGDGRLAIAKRTNRDCNNMFAR